MVIAIMGILLIISQRVVTEGFEFYRTTDESIRLQKEGLLALTWITRDAVLSHHRSIEVVRDDPSSTVGDPAWREDEITIPLPKDLNGNSLANDQGALTWRSIVAYQVDTDKHKLLRHVGDTANDPDYVTGEPAPNDYISNIELVASPPSAATVAGWPDINTRVAARNVVEFVTEKRVDTLDISMTIFFRSRNDKENSLTLDTTVFPKN